MSDFKIGDNVFHKSNSKIAWTIEKLDGNEAFCSALINETYEQKKVVFAIKSIKKCTEPEIIVINRTRNNYY